MDVLCALYASLLTRGMKVIVRKRSNSVGPALLCNGSITSAATHDGQWALRRGT